MTPFPHASPTGHHPAPLLADAGERREEPHFLLKLLGHQVQISECSADVSVARHPLDGVEVGAVGEHPGCRRVAVRLALNDLPFPEAPKAL